MAIMTRTIYPPTIGANDECGHRPARTLSVLGRRSISLVLDKCCAGVANEMWLRDNFLGVTP